LSRSAGEIALLLDAAGKDVVLIETVGVGQDEIDIVRTADVSVVVIVPGAGDEVQALKAGIMEIADIFVVNKADRPGADRLRHELELMLGLRGGNTLKNVPAHHGVDLGRAMTREEKRAMNPARAAREAAADDSTGWTPPVLRTVAVQAEGIAELAAAVERHFNYLERSGVLRTRRRARLRARVVEVVESEVRRRLWTDETTNRWVDERLADLESGATNPFAVASELLSRSAQLLTRTGSQGAP